MHRAAKEMDESCAKRSVKYRVERDIDTLSRKIVRLENEPHSNDQLLAAYRLMLKTRTEVLECLLHSIDTPSVSSHR